MQLEEGKFYLGSDGKKYGPLIFENGIYHDGTSCNVWCESGCGVDTRNIIAEWTDKEPEKLTIARVEFNGGIGNARVILSNGMELGGVTYVEAAAGLEEITLVGLVAHVDRAKKEPFSEYGNYGENNGPV